MNQEYTTSDFLFRRKWYIRKKTIKHSIITTTLIIISLILITAIAITTKKVIPTTNEKVDLLIAIYFLISSIFLEIFFSLFFIVYVLIVIVIFFAWVFNRSNWKLGLLLLILIILGFYLYYAGAFGSTKPIKEKKFELHSGILALIFVADLTLVFIFSIMWIINLIKWTNLSESGSQEKKNLIIAIITWFFMMPISFVFTLLANSELKKNVSNEEVEILNSLVTNQIYKYKQDLIYEKITLDKAEISEKIDKHFD